MHQPIPPHTLDFWRTFARTRGDAVDERFYELCVFGDDEHTVNALADRVLRGVKRVNAWSVLSTHSPQC